jgi:hypothetical protein
VCVCVCVSWCLFQSRHTEVKLESWVLMGTNSGFFVLFCFETGSHYVSWTSSSCLSLLSAGITDVCHHTWLILGILMPLLAKRFTLSPGIVNLELLVDIQVNR